MGKGKSRKKGIRVWVEEVGGVRGSRSGRGVGRSRRRGRRSRWSVGRRRGKRSRGEWW